LSENTLQLVPEIFSEKELEMTLSPSTLDLAEFLVNAKIATYASGSDKFAVKPDLADSHQLEYSVGNRLYRDIYYGGMRFIGMETIFLNSQPIWGMSYYGGVLPGSSDHQIAGMPPFLKAALREVPLEAPFRGPKSYNKDVYNYKNEIHGDINNFNGTEIICFQEQAIYRLFYTGGVVE